VTTPERLRRRQRREEILLIVLGILVGVTAIYFHGQDVKQRECIASNTADLNSVLTKRGELAAQESRVNAAESAATRQLIVDAFASKDRQEAFAAFRKAQHGWEQVDKDRKRIVRKRAANPLPDFPAGVCG
jgi:hypothetical protein